MTSRGRSRVENFQNSKFSQKSQDLKKVPLTISNSPFCPENQIIGGKQKNAKFHVKIKENNQKSRKNKKNR